MPAVDTLEVGEPAGLHLLCRGLPLLTLCAVSFAFLRPTWPVIGSALAVVGALALSGA